MLKLRVFSLALLVGVSCAGVVPSYPAQQFTTIAKISAPLPYAAPRLTYAAQPAVHAAPVAYAPSAYAHAAPVAYAPQIPSAYAAHGYAPVTKVATPVAYAAHAPVVAPAYAKYAAPVAYAAHAPVVGAPIAKAVVGHAVDTDYDPNPSYNYAYDIQDALTGDSKNQQESRQGDVVQGSYSLTEPDGTRRTVEYTADPVNGFNAVVHREPAVVQKAVVAAHAPVAYAAHAPVLSHPSPVYASHAYAPVAKAVAAPVAYSPYH